MSVQSRIDGAIAHLGQVLGMELRLDENRACRLAFDSGLAVDFEVPESMPDTLVMTCTLAKGVPADVREATFKNLLEGNFFGRGTGGGVLAYDETREELVLQRMLAITHADGNDVVTALESMLSHGSAWVEQIKEMVSSDTGEQSQISARITYDMRV